ncbi:hypothetical protein [Streptomyces microflavus]
MGQLLRYAFQPWRLPSGAAENRNIRLDRNSPAIPSGGCPPGRLRIATATSSRISLPEFLDGCDPRSSLTTTATGSYAAVRDLAEELRFSVVPEDDRHSRACHGQVAPARLRSSVVPEDDRHRTSSTDGGMYRPLRSSVVPEDDRHPSGR